jgi:hypothetical protein
MFNFVAFLAWIVSLSVWIGMMFCSANTNLQKESLMHPVPESD